MTSLYLQSEILSQKLEDFQELLPPDDIQALSDLVALLVAGSDRVLADSGSPPSLRLFDPGLIQWRVLPDHHHPHVFSSEWLCLYKIQE
nr:hypothetical protein [Tanacetum cinerariifolium]